MARIEANKSRKKGRSRRQSEKVQVAGNDIAHRNTHAVENHNKLWQIKHRGGELWPANFSSMKNCSSYYSNLKKYSLFQLAERIILIDASSAREIQ